MKMKDLMERKKIQKYKLTNENREKLVAMNEILTEFITGKEWDVSSLNALHYSAAVVLAGEVPDKPVAKRQKKSKTDHLEVKVARLRKSIGNLTAFLNKKVKKKNQIFKLTKKEKPETVLM